MTTCFDCRHTGQCGISSSPGKCSWFKPASWTRGSAAIRALFWIMTALLIGIALALVFAPKAHADEAESLNKNPRAWTAGDTALQAAFLLALAVDRGQTAYGGNENKQYQEVGWARNFIGPHPSSGQVNRYFATCAIIHTAVAYMLPKSYRAIWQSFFIGVEMSSINSNVNAGISVRF